MKMKKRTWITLLLATVSVAALALLGGCGKSADNGKIKVELVQYKQEAVKVFEALAEKFNATHDDIELVVDSPNDAMTILKTRFIREDYPDIIGIGGDINYSNFLDADMFMDVSDFDGLADINEAYLEMDKQLEFIPKDGVYGVPYVANAAGVLYNKDLFAEHGWEIPTNWPEFMTLCEEIEGRRDTALLFRFQRYMDLSGSLECHGRGFSSSRCMQPGQ